jgi:hypothetical protein
MLGSAFARSVRVIVSMLTPTRSQARFIVLRAKIGESPLAATRLSNNVDMQP